MINGNLVKKVIIDCDPGIDDAVAISMALFDPRLEVVAITATAGTVPAEQASRNVQAIIERLDPPRFPRLGAATYAEGCAGTDNRQLHGEDGLGNAGFAVSRLHHQHPSEKVICDAVRADPHRVTLVCLGPLANVARAFQRDPELPTLLDRLVMVGGCVDGIGNVTAAAEYNMFFDSNSARTVFRSPVTKTLVPLDITRSVRLTLDFLDRLPPETSRVGVFLRQILPFLYRAYHQRVGQESILLHDAVGLAAVLDPTLFECVEMSGDVETRGELTLGTTVFDRRYHPQWRPNMDVAMRADPEKVVGCIVNSLALAGSTTSLE
ncbi:MAG: nucleoside hydrolase [Pirellulaceae bacterium]